MRHEAQVRRKVAAVHMSRSVTQELITSCFDALDKEGMFPDPVQEAVTSEFLPWLFGATARVVDRAQIAQQLLDLLLSASLAKQAELQRAETERRDALRRQMDEERSGRIRIFVAMRSRLVGPVPVLLSDTIVEVESKIQAWLEANVTDGEVPRRGELHLVFNGRELDPSTTLREAAVPQNASIEIVTRPVEPSGVDADGDASATADGGDE